MNKHQDQDQRLPLSQHWEPKVPALSGRGPGGEGQSLRRQYASSDPLKVRIETHRRCSEREVDLDVESASLMQLTGTEAILDVGSGPGRFELFLRAQGHRGPLVAVDQSRTMMREAAEALSAAGHKGRWIVGDAQHLPLRDGSFDWVVARHMLYHVPDIPAALREFRRVLHPGGRLLVCTNAGANLPGVLALYHEMLAAFGLAPVAPAQEGFSIENAASFLREVFPVVERVVIQNALIFREPEPLVRYLATLFPSLPIAGDGALLARMRQWLSDEARRRIEASGGVWRDPKDVGFFVCTTT